ncbi:MAG: homoserine dehydrogenase [Oscillospiraceae bacterium]|nr:homoserine dehydrogenase [Oscillospiraceae bacterium]
MKIGLLGFGVVGRGVYDITADMEDIQVAKVVCLENVELPDAEVTKDFQSVLNDDTIDTVVEAMGGLHPAYEFVRAAIEAGKNIVTSNKALVCSFYDELLPLAESKGVQFRCTAAVGGGIGWLSELERSRRVQPIERVGGIMNGTCNYILDSMTRLGLGYDEALKQAQQLGYAEAKPATDVEGIDTWHKVILSSNIAFGISLDTATVPVAGISKITAADVAAFTERGYTCKLISTGKSLNGKYTAYVQPTLVKAGQPEAAVPSNFNLITLDGKYSGRMSFFGQGAGRYPTAYNVVQDCKDLLAGKGFYSPYGPKAAAVNDEKLTYYVRGTKDAWLEAHTAENWGDAVLTRPVTVDEIHAWLKNNDGAFIAAIAEDAL